MSKFLPVKFKIYNGPRIILPPGLNVSNSVKFKFKSLETIFNYNKIREEISNRIATCGFNFNGSIDYTNPYYMSEISEWKIVKSIYQKIFKFKRNLMALILNWQIRKCIKNIKNTNDPATLEAPVKPVYVIDFKNRNSFVFEASTIKKTFDNRIFISDYMFPLPSDPVNILTHQTFNLGQLISIIKQCKQHGISSWLFESLINVGYDIELFISRHKPELRVKAIETFFSKSAIEIQDTVLDFFDLKAEDLRLPYAYTRAFTEAYDTTPEMPIVRRFIRIVKDYYIASELNSPKLLIKLTKEVNSFYISLYDIFK